MNLLPEQEIDGGGPIRCPLCGNGRCVSYCVAKDLNWGIPGEFEYLKCKACKFIFQWPQPELSNIKALYPEFYGTKVDGLNADIDRYVENGANRMRADVLSRFCPKGSIFDVGCGCGLFLEYMYRRGREVGGVEPASEHVTFAREKFKMANVMQGSWPESGITGRKWDVCSFIHVIEHLPGPVEMLAQARDVLNPGGWLILETPNVRSWPARLFGSNWVSMEAPRHLYLFSPDSLSECVKRAGFRTRCLMTYSPSTMEYSESLRYVMQEKGWRSPKKIGKVENINKLSLPVNTSSIRFLDAVHNVENSFYRGLNRLAGAIGSGCNILLIASMSADPGYSGE
jgi:SAM-dependent methyltransferase